MPFKDHFSGHAALYRDARPLPPPAWYDWLAGQVPDAGLAWDAGCGNGQASVALAAHFERVLATDPSAGQIANAQAHARVDYRVEAAEHCSLEDGAASLVDVSQALHWFDLAAFHDEARRVLKPGGVIAVSAYGNCSVDRAVDAVERRLYADTLADDWPPERAQVDNGYRDLPFPFARIEAPTFEMRADWNLAQFLAYLRSWSATQRHIKAHDEDPVAAAAPALALAWGDAVRVRAVRWPFFTVVGRSA
jgi:SAM-dependent methyltransferase